MAQDRRDLDDDQKEEHGSNNGLQLTADKRRQLRPDVGSRTNMRTILITATLSATALISLAEGTNEYPACLTEAIRRSATAPHTSTARCEAVMVEGMSIAFTNAHGEMTITGGKGFERSYTWAGDTRALTMWPRTERWYGSLGMYNPGSYIEGELEQWKEHDGIKRCVAEEGQRHFTNTAAALEWINKRGDRLDYVYNDSGLVVGMDKQPESLEERKRDDFPGTLSVEVWQIYIDGKKPQTLEGSKNNLITVHYPPTYDMETVEPPREPVDHDYCPFDASKYFKHIEKKE